MALAAPLVGGTHEELVDLLRALTDGLSQNNGVGFLDHFDHSMPDYYQLERYIDALAANYELSCSVDITKQEGDDQAQTAELDWFLEIHPRGPIGEVERRRQNVKIRLERRKKKWKIMAIEPITLFAPPAVR